MEAMSEMAETIDEIGLDCLTLYGGERPQRFTWMHSGLCVSKIHVDCVELLRYRHS